MHQVLVVAHEIFSCGIWDLVPWPGTEPGPPALGVRSLSHWTREVLTSASVRPHMVEKNNSKKSIKAPSLIPLVTPTFVWANHFPALRRKKGRPLYYLLQRSSSFLVLTLGRLLPPATLPSFPGLKRKPWFDLPVFCLPANNILPDRRVLVAIHVSSGQSSSFVGLLFSLVLLLAIPLQDPCVLFQWSSGLWGFFHHSSRKEGCEAAVRRIMLVTSPSRYSTWPATSEDTRMHSCFRD